MPVIERLPAVKSLSQILPTGAEGGKEFARIVDLLLFHDARRHGKKLSLYNDAAGDFAGLDSFAGDRYRREGTTGYQYKFFPSPLSDGHRQNISETLSRTVKKVRRQKLQKWILVTPDDLIESAIRKKGGDVTWFENLRQELGLKFELEHWGHKNLLALFLETPSLCLYYYPELIPEGANRRQTIHDLRTRYDENLLKLYRQIQFVGMSVYKPEATKGVPMEHIYIPLTAVPWGTEETGSASPRIDPLSFLETGSHSVVLGDPGSGKSTMLRFLALSGISDALQKRYSATPDDRLPILVTLRRYADELKSRANLSLLDYILECVKSDFTLAEANLEFLKYYLESGQAILLFDGLDELPGSHFKQIVRDRISSLVTAFPKNTAIVTTRIVGYEQPFGFERGEFRHFVLTKLRLPEMERFVADWYAVRVESLKEREHNVQDLSRILRDENHTAIRELAENPLLLTIVALVHRIDAVLPDERVVLYQKCTETLLNTWHTWKFREFDIKNRGKVERRNRYRIEAVAHWMHGRSVSQSRTERAVVSHKELHEFLTRHITENEKSTDPEEDPQDLAADFLEFVKTRAGLLIEVGDNRYSFVHLTFQEYLTSSHIITTSEKNGANEVWKTIKPHCSEPRWHEVIRLLIAGLKSNDTQKYLLRQMMADRLRPTNIKNAQVLGGLLVDGIEPAQERAKEILNILLVSACAVDNTEGLRTVLSMLKTWLPKDAANQERLHKSLVVSGTKAAGNRVPASLIGASLNLPQPAFENLSSTLRRKHVGDFRMFDFFFSPNKPAKITSIGAHLEPFLAENGRFIMHSEMHNFVASAALGFLSPLSEAELSRIFFEQALISLATGYVGPFNDFFANSIAIYAPSILEQKASETYSSPGERKVVQEFVKILDLARRRALRRPGLRLKVNHARILAVRRLERAFLGARMKNQKISDLNENREPSSSISHIRRRFIRSLIEGRPVDSAEALWKEVLTSPETCAAVLNFVIAAFELDPTPQWFEALRAKLLSSIPKLIATLRPERISILESAFESNKFKEEEVYGASCHLLVDTWLHLHNFRASGPGYSVSKIAELTKAIDSAPLQIAHCIRDIAMGDRDRIKDLVSAIRSNRKDFQQLFERCLWLGDFET